MISSKRNASIFGTVLLGAAVMSAGLWNCVRPAEAARLENPVAVFSGIDKITGRITSFDVYINETVQFGALQVTPKVCYSRDDSEAQQTDAFVEVDEITLDRKIRRIFSGWMFADSPGLNAVEHAIYDVWLSGCKATSDVPPPEGAQAVHEAPVPESQKEKLEAAQKAQSDAQSTSTSTQPQQDGNPDAVAVDGATQPVDPQDGSVAVPPLDSPQVIGDQPQGEFSADGQLDPQGQFSSEGQFDQQDQLQPLNGDQPQGQPVQPQIEGVQPGSVGLF